MDEIASRIIRHKSLLRAIAQSDKIEYDAFLHLTSAEARSEAKKLSQSKRTCSSRYSMHRAQSSKLAKQERSDRPVGTHLIPHHGRGHGFLDSAKSPYRLFNVFVVDSPSLSESRGTRMRPIDSIDTRVVLRNVSQCRRRSSMLLQK